jgi:hypothetical protein
VEQSRVHWTKSLIRPCPVWWLVAEVKIVGESIICYAIRLDTITQPFVLSTPGFVLTPALHLTRLLVYRKVFAQNPRRLPDMPTPTEQLIHLHVGTFLFWRRNKEGILATKEVAKGSVGLFVSRPDTHRNEVISMRPLFRLRLHFLDQPRGWGESIYGIDSHHLRDVLWLEVSADSSKDVPLFSCIA